MTVTLISKKKLVTNPLLYQDLYAVLIRVECERLRKVVVTKVKTNDQAEQDINRLDIMIGLMLKNKIEWDEINSHRGQIAQRLNSTITTSSDPLDLKALNK